MAHFAVRSSSIWRIASNVQSFLKCRPPEAKFLTSGIKGERISSGSGVSDKAASPLVKACFLLVLFGTVVMLSGPSAGQSLVLHNSTRTVLTATILTLV
jgi:hypothetical protein